MDAAYNEFLLISCNNRGELKHIASSEIWYIEAEENYSNIFLTNGKKLVVCIQLGIFNNLIKKWFPYNHKYFCRVGRSLIINKKYLSSFNVSQREIVLADKRSDVYMEGFLDGYKTGYDAGYLDRDGCKRPLISSAVHPSVKVLKASEDALRELKKEIEKDVIEKIENNVSIEKKQNERE